MVLGRQADDVGEQQVTFGREAKGMWVNINRVPLSILKAIS